jgi:hypothetical protein
MSVIPDSPVSCNSWVLTRIETGEVLGEVYDPRLVDRVNPERVRVETAYAYLVRVNREIREGKHHVENC